MNYFLHGNLGSAEDWADFGEGEKVDLWKDADKSLWDWALDFCAEVRERDSGNNRLVGYSMGGRLGLHALIAGGPELWSGAMIIAAHPGLSIEREREERDRQDYLLSRGALEWPWEKFLNAWNSKPVLLSRNFSPSQLALEKRREAVALAFENWSLGKQEDLRRHLKTLDIPVKWVTGENDEKFTEIGREMAELMPNCKHVSVANCGHRVIFDSPGDVSGLLD